jgi:hypothetical protein
MQPSKREVELMAGAYKRRGQGRYFLEVYDDHPTLNQIIELKKTHPPGTPFTVKDGSGRDIQCMNKLFSFNRVSKLEQANAKVAVRRFKSGGPHPQPITAEQNCWEEDEYYTDDQVTKSKNRCGVCRSRDHTKTNCPYPHTIKGTEYKPPPPLKPKKCSTTPKQKARETRLCVGAEGGEGQRAV